MMVGRRNWTKLVGHHLDKGIEKVFLTILIHGRVEALGQATSPTLIAMRFIYGTSSLQFACRLARINPIPVDAPLEEPTAA